MLYKYRINTDRPESLKIGSHSIDPTTLNYFYMMQKIIEASLFPLSDHTELTISCLTSGKTVRY